MTATRVPFSELCNFTAKQWLATETADNHRYTLFGGARGPGKSYWLRWYCLRRLLFMGQAGFRNTRIMLASEDYPSLRERQISKIETEFPAWLGKLHISSSEFRLAPQYGGGVIALRNLDDPAKYQSAEFALIAIDEIGKNPERTFHIVRGSLRWPGYPATSLICASNPTPNWVRSFWIERNFPPELQKFAPQFAFVPALPDDNPHLSSEYWDELDSIPGALGKAWRKGEWYAAVDGLVYEEFSENNLTDMEPNPDLPIELAIDDGYTDPRAILFVQRQPGGDMLIFDELYKSKTLEERHIREVMEVCARRHNKALPDDWHKLELDRAAQWCGSNGVRVPRLAVVSHEAVALRSRLANAGIPAVNWLNRKNPESGSTRLAAITLTRTLVCDDRGYRAVKVHRRCRNLIDELSMGYQYPQGKNGLEDMPADGNDHAVQALETWVWWNYGGNARKKATVR